MATIDKIAKLVGGGLKTAGMTRSATLIVVTPGTRTPGAVSGGTNPTTANVKARGLVVKWLKKRLNQSDVHDGDRVVALFGALIAGGTIPKVSDRIAIEDETTSIVDIERDAAKACYFCLTR